MRKLKRFKAWPLTSCLCILSSLVFFIQPPVLLASPPNVVLSRAIHFPTMKGNPVTLSPGKYLVEQAGSTELRLTAQSNNQEFLIRAETSSHEQYELFSAMALTRPNKNHEFLIELFLPGGVRLKARGSTKELLTPPSSKEDLQISQMGESLSPPLNPKPPKDSQVARIIPDPEPPTPLQTPQIRDQMPPDPIVPEAPMPLLYHAPYPDQSGLRIDSVNVDKQNPSLFTLTPNHVGLTSVEHPVLYWYLSQRTHAPLAVMIAEEENSVTLLNIHLLPPLQAGIHELRLEDYGINLRPNVPYRWTIRILASHTSENSTASGAIQRIESSADSSASLASSPQDYAQKGLWYDALTALNLLIQSNPGNTDLLAQRVSLLKQVGLTEPAAFEQ